MYYLLDTDLELVAPIETYKSAIWATRFYESGDFELYIPATERMLNIFLEVKAELVRKNDMFITRDDDLTQAMIIQNIQITTDIEEGNFIIITGKSLKSLLGRRIIWKQTTVSGTVEKCIRQLIDENIIKPTDTARKINKFILGAELGNTETIKAQFTGKNLEESIQGICKKHKIGYDVLLDFEKKQFVFVLLRGQDRTYNQDNNAFIVFSNEFENLLTTNYAYIGENYRNVALVAGEGEGAARKTHAVGSATGLKRYELYVDSRNTSTGEAEETLSDTEYKEILAEQGKEALTEHEISENLEGDVEANHTWKYGVDYFLGDFVEVVNEYGHSMQPQITEVIESEDDAGKNIVVTFATEIEGVE